MVLDLRHPEALNLLFETVLIRDKERLQLPDFYGRWLFAERLKARDTRGEMGFFAYEGLIHMRKFFNWHGSAHFPDYFASEDLALHRDASVEVDEKVFAHHGLLGHGSAVAKVGAYNAQDHLLLYGYAKPERNRVKVQLDFGAGHGRLANLAFHAPDESERLQTYIAVDAIPSTYFTQLAYFEGMNLEVWEYFDYYQDDLTQADLTRAIQDFDVVHLPTWRTDLLPDGCVDLVSCVQVLKELPGPLVNEIIPIFRRLTHATGAIYIRDHKQFHNPNHMPIELLLQGNGFDIEFAPQIIDRTELHGLPRIWRKVDPSHFISRQHNS